MTTVFFTRKFHKGNLIGLTHDDKISFPTMEGAVNWVKGIKANYAKLDYVLESYRFE